MTGPQDFTPEELIALFEECLEPYEAVIQSALDTMDCPAVAIPFGAIDRYNPDLALYLRDHPGETLKAAEETVRRIAAPDGDVGVVRVRITEPPRDLEVPVRMLRPVHSGTFLAVRGIVSVASTVQFRIVTGFFACLRCGTVLKEPAETDHIREPLECYEDQGGCKRSANATKFRLVGNACERVANQFLEVQEMPEDTARVPERLSAVLEGDDLVGRVQPGDRVLLTGVLKATITRRRGVMDPMENTYLDVCALEVLERLPEEVELTGADVAAIEELADRPDVFDLLRDSFAPSIIGYEVEKLAFVLQAFGGVAKDLPDGRRIRGDIHALMPGDPGTVKSGLLAAAAKFALRGRTVTASSASAVGLTGTAEQVKFQGIARWTAKAGLMPLSDRGFLAIDELDKMSEEDRGRIHEALDPQVFTIAKASVVLTLWSRCAVLAACNPKHGRFDETKFISDEIDLPGTLLSRFDAIFPVRDMPEKAHDRRLAEQLLRVHQAWDNPASDALMPKIPLESIHKHMAYAKRIVPRLSDGVLAMIRDYYVDLRGQGNAEGTVSATPRQLESLVRFAEASARVRLSQVVEVQDAQRAMAIYDYWTAKVIRDEFGRADIDIVTSGTSQSQRDHILAIREAMIELGGDAQGVPEEDILAGAERRGIKREKAAEWLKRLLHTGEVYSPSQNRYRLVERM